jgi:hypothetical protein
MTVRLLRQGQGTQGLDEQMFSDYEQTLFTRVVAIAERHGRHVMLLVAPGTNIFDALARAAVQLRAGSIVGRIRSDGPDQQAHRLGEAWDRTPKTWTCRPAWSSCAKTAASSDSLGAHLPDLSSADIERIHKLWVDTVARSGPTCITATSSPRLSARSKTS